MSDEPSVQAVIELLKRKHACVSHTDFLINVKDIRKHIKKTFPSLSPHYVTLQSSIACAILVEMRLLSVWDLQIDSHGKEREIFQINSEVLINA